MPDRYIDYDEVSEYGRPLLSALASLAGQSNLADLAKLESLVSAAIVAVESELQSAKIDRSSLRGERAGTAEASEALRDGITRFFHFIRSLPKSVGVDVDAFFPGRTLGGVAHLKPADLLSKGRDLLRGFDTPKNKGIAALSTWTSEIDSMCQTLSIAITGKGDASADAFVATAELIAARKNFLHVYNRVAKPIVRGVLAHLGREDEFPLFFKDLTVNEGGSSTPAQNAPAATPT